MHANVCICVCIVKLESVNILFGNYIRDTSNKIYPVKFNWNTIIKSMDSLL